MYDMIFTFLSLRIEIKGKLFIYPGVSINSTTKEGLQDHSLLTELKDKLDLQD